MNDEQSWRTRALCAEVDPELFFPTAPGRPPQYLRQICFRCQVRPQCLEYAIETKQEHGIWGGMTESERNRLSNGQRKVA